MSEEEFYRFIMRMEREVYGDEEDEEDEEDEHIQ